MALIYLITLLELVNRIHLSLVGVLYKIWDVLLGPYLIILFQKGWHWVQAYSHTLAFAGERVHISS